MYGLYQIMYFTVIDIKNTLLSPFFIVIFFIIIYQYYQLGKTDCGLTTHKTSALLKTLNSTLYGILGGFITTISLIYLEVAIIPKDFIYILTVAIILSLINPRFMCFSYGGSIVSLFSIIFGYPKVDAKDIMLVVATLHLVESLLIFLNGNNGKLPACFEHRGDIVGGYNINRFWPIPFVIFIGDGLIKPITLMAILTYGDFTLSYPRKKTITTSLILLIYSISLLTIAKLQINPLTAPLFALFGHEFIIYINKIHEKNRTPIFTTANKGVRVIEVSRRGVARVIGIKAGDIIISINEVIMHDEKDIHEIEMLRNHNMKISFFNIRKGIVTKTYNGKRKTLGITIVPKGLY